MVYNNEIWCNIFSKRMDFNSCINCARCLPKEILQKIFKEFSNSEFKENSYGVTELLYCLRQSYYRRIKIDYPTLTEIFKLVRGHMFHKFFGSEFEIRELRLEKDFGDFKIVGIADASNGNLYEFKSVTRLPSMYYPQHALQIQAYDTLNDLKAKRLILVYFTMNNFVWFEIPKKDVTDWLKYRASKLHLALKEGKPPDMEPTLCGWCPFRLDCFSSNCLILKDQEAQKF
jgi:hypothetical protein